MKATKLKFYKDEIGSFGSDISFITRGSDFIAHVERYRGVDNESTYITVRDTLSLDDLEELTTLVRSLFE